MSVVRYHVCDEVLCLSLQSRSQTLSKGGLSMVKDTLGSSAGTQIATLLKASFSLQSEAGAADLPTFNIPS